MKKTVRVLMAALLTITMTTGGFPAAALAEETNAATEASAQQGTAGKPSADNGTKNAAEAKQFAGENDAAKEPEPETASPESAAAEPAAQSPENAIAPTITTATYTHTETAEQNGVKLTLGWNDAPAGEPTTFHLSATGGSGAYKFRMDAPFYMNPGEGYFGEMVADTSRGQWMTWTSSDTGCDYDFTMTASGRYYYRFYLQDAQNGVWSLRVAAEAEVSDDAHPSVDQIITNAVAQCRQETSGSEYDMALWLHDWTLNQLEYDYNLNWCSAESGLTRHQGTCESYQRIYAKLLDAASIANGRITGNGHTWNAVKIDGKWCQMDLTWDDTNDNWYGDLDQRHLYFGLTDELMAIAHSDHTATYQKDGYAYRSTDLSNNYFVRNGKANEWAGAYADRIQQRLNAKETEFSIDADNGTIPPSISGIQNAIVAYAMNQREWSNADGAVTLTAASNVTTVSSYEWSARFDFEVEYPVVALIPDGSYKIMSTIDAASGVTISESSCSMTKAPRALYFKFDAFTARYSITANGKALTMTGAELSLTEPDGSTSQQWSLVEAGGGYAIVNAATGNALDDRWRDTGEGALVWGYASSLGDPAQTWALTAPAAQVIEDGQYRIMSSINDSMGVSAFENGCTLSSAAGCLEFSFDADKGFYTLISADGKALTMSGTNLSLATPDGSASQQWSVTAVEGGYAIVNAATGNALDDRWRDTGEGALVWGYASSLGDPAQTWAFVKAA